MDLTNEIYRRHHRQHRDDMYPPGVIVTAEYNGYAVWHTAAGYQQQPKWFTQRADAIEYAVSAAAALNKDLG